MASACVVATATTALVVPNATASPQINAAGGPTAIADSYIVVFDDNVVSAPDASRVIDLLAAKAHAEVDFEFGSALHGFAGTMTESAARVLAAEPAVASVSQNHTIKATAEQLNPPSWGLDQVDQRALPLDGKYQYDTTASNVNAYVIDTGIRISHTDFGGRATFDYNSVDTMNVDCNGHGTHVAGTLGGTKYGIAKAVKLHAVKVLDCDGLGSTASIVAGIDWVTAHAVKPAVANLSVGGEADPALDTALRNSINSGITFAVSSGNLNRDACASSPARVTEAITVNASDIGGSRAPFSNFGQCTDIFAPGVDITSAWSGSDSDSDTISGTSMAAPHVAGAAALYLSTNPTANPQQTQNAVVAMNSTRGRIRDAAPGSPNVQLFVGKINDNVKAGEKLLAGESKISPNRQYRLTVQTDGNLVLYNADGVAQWYTNTYGTGSGNYLTLQPDGNLVLYNANGTPLWNTQSYGSTANILIVQNDGNVVLYGPGNKVFWHRMQ